MSSRKGILSQIDLITILLWFGLMIAGWFMIYAVGYDDKNPRAITDLDSSSGKQLIFIGLVVLLFFVVQIMDWKFWRTFSYLTYAISLFFLVLVLFLGTKIKGATAWFSIFGFGFQPAELAKFGTSLALSNFASGMVFRLSDRKTAITTAGIILSPVALIMFQPDAGSALVFSSFLLLLFREGLSPIYFIIAIFLVGVFIGALLFNTPIVIMALLLMALAALLTTKSDKNYWFTGLAMLLITNVIAVVENLELYAILLDILLFIFVAVTTWQRGEVRMNLILIPSIIIGSGLAFFANYTFDNVLAPHQQDRINVWLHPDKCDPQGSLYNLMQSKMAISSGGLKGKGYLDGTLTKLNYVPEQSTDFIFCTIGEEHGFVGIVITISLFVALFLRLLILAERQRLHFVRNYIYCVLGILFFHFFINIGMTMGLVPIIGIPLPFMSYGGSSLLGFGLMMSVLIKLDTTRTGGG
jgi:rod shape determining protein RodA